MTPERLAEIKNNQKQEYTIKEIYPMMCYRSNESLEYNSGEIKIFKKNEPLKTHS